MSRDIVFHARFESEFAVLTESVQDELLKHAQFLGEFGPTLGRPTVDTLKGSRVANLKDLRFAADGGVWRVLFAFDRQRIAVLLVAGDKRGQPTARFYRRPIDVAEARWDEWE